MCKQLYISDTKNRKIRNLLKGYKLCNNSNEPYLARNVKDTHML